MMKWYTNKSNDRILNEKSFENDIFPRGLSLSYLVKENGKSLIYEQGGWVIPFYKSESKHL